MLHVHALTACCRGGGGSAGRDALENAHITPSGMPHTYIGIISLACVGGSPLHHKALESSVACSVCVAVQTADLHETRWTAGLGPAQGH